MVQYKTPVTPGSSATDALYTYVVVIDVDLNNLIAHVVDQFGANKQVSITRSYGKTTQYPAAGETWIITRQFGDWIFAVNINNIPIPDGLPAGGNTNDVLAKVSGTDYDVQWKISTSSATADSMMLRDASGRSKVADPAAATDIANKEYVDSGNPTGTIHMWTGTTAPANYMLCDGSAISRTTYAALFAVMGTAYGVGDGSTTFNLPNMKGKVATGLDSTQTEFNTLGETGGAKTHAHGTSLIVVASHTHASAAHAHNLSDLGQADIVFSGTSAIHRRITTASWTATTVGIISSTTNNVTANTSGIGLTGTTDNATPAATGAATPGVTGNTDSASNLSPYVVVNYIIKL